MPPKGSKDLVLCLCCNSYLSRKEERKHRKRGRQEDQATTSEQEPASKVPRLSLRNALEKARQVVKERILARPTSPSRSLSSEPLLQAPDHGHMLSPAPSIAGNEIYEDLIAPCSQTETPMMIPESVPMELPRWEDVAPRWRSLRSAEGDEADDLSDDDGDEADTSLPDVPVEDEGDDDENDLIDWEAIAKDCGLSDWDNLAEHSERQFAEAAEKLDEYDRAICRAFAYKHTTRTTDNDWKKAPYAFHTDPPIPKLSSVRSRVTFLSGFVPEFYDCCVNSCVNYVGEHASKQRCPECNQNRYRPDGKPRKRFLYIPVIPRLRAFKANTEMATKMQNRHLHQSQPGIIRDIPDSDHYKALKTQNVKLGNRTFDHKYFEDPRDVALGLSTDGFAPFNKRKHTAWPLILFNFNLHPDIRFHLEYIIALGVIPGPKKPKDTDSFLWPFMQELFRLMIGVRAFDILKSELFLLRAYLILVFGDIPAVSLLMKMKGHNGVCPCRMCEIHGLRIPDSRATTHYVPLDQSPHPNVRKDRQRIQKYDPRELPLRTHANFMTQASKVDNASTATEAAALAKDYGIKGKTIFSYLHSLSFPGSFPYDFMHLIWENTIKNLILHWTGEFKGLDDGREQYIIPKAIWEGIGRQTKAAGSTIPSAYGPRVPDIMQDRSACTADMWSFWTLYLGPVLLRRRFKNEKYYNHFIDLVVLLNLCLQFEITDEEIEQVRQGFIRWVATYEDLYYQHKPERLSTCPVTIHALLHIADSIKFCGPVWCYWAFPMERYCNRLKQSVRSRRFPYASMDRFVLEEAQLTQIKAVYGVAEELSLRAPRVDLPRGVFQDDRSYPSCILLRPRVSPANTTNEILQAMAAALSTRFNIPSMRIKRHLQNSALIEEWGKVRRVDSSEGDTMCSASLGSRQAEDRRDATFVRYEMLVDKNAHIPRRRPEYEPQTFYGQIEHIYLIKFTCDDPVLEPGVPRIMAAIRSCRMEPPAAVTKLDIHFYSTTSGLDYIDVTSIQALVGRVPVTVAGAEWAVIDRSGSLARAVFEDEVEEHDD